MSHVDRAGLPVSLDDPAALAEWEATVAAFLSHGASTPLHLERTLERAPDFALGWATKGLMLGLLARRELSAPIQDALARARRGRAAGREAAYVEALALWTEGRLAAAADRLDAVLLRQPGDALALKLVHAIRFVLGDAPGMRRSAEAAAPAYDHGHPHAGYAAGCRAFALEETGAYAAAEAEGRAGLELAPDDAWGLHAVAHVFEMTGRAAEGAAWLEAGRAGFDHCGNFGFHVWWHVALFRLDQGDREAALALYDEKVRAQRTDDYRDLANAASLLVRLEIEGVEVGERWSELAALAEARVEDGLNVFADLHYLLALTRAGRGEAARRLADRLAADARRAGTDMERAAAAAGGPAAEGLVALSDGACATAWARLSEAAAALARIGGSHAQRDVFDWLRIDAALRSGRLPEAASALAQRARRRSGRDGFTARRFAALSHAATRHAVGLAL